MYTLGQSFINSRKSAGLNTGLNGFYKGVVRLFPGNTTRNINAVRSAIIYSHTIIIVIITVIVSFIIIIILLLLLF